METLLLSTAVTTLAKTAFSQLSSLAIGRVRKEIEAKFAETASAERLRSLLAAVEARVRVLAGPVDLCVQIASAGNSVLQAGVEHAHSLLREIDDLSSSMARPAAPTSSPGTSQSAERLCERLKKLIEDLDATVNYLSLGLQTVQVARSAAAASPLSPARLVRATRLLREAAAAAASGTEAEVMRAPVKVYQLTAVSVARKRAHADHCLQELWPRAAARVAVRRGGVVELQLTQDLDDGRYHDEQEAPGRLALPAAAVLALEFTTRDAMRVGAGDQVPLLMLLADASAAGQRGNGAGPSTPAPGQPPAASPAPPPAERW